MEISIMKKQIIAAAVAASLSAVALADVAITGSAKVNWTSKDAGASTGATRAMTHELDYNVVGKSGDTAFHANIESTRTGAQQAAQNDTASNTDNSDLGFNVKNQYMTTKVGNFDVKMGNWYTGDSNLHNGATQDSQVQFGTTMGPASVQFNHMPNVGAESSDHNEIHVKTEIAGVKLGIERENTNDHTIYNISGDMAGVNFAFTDSSSNASSDNEQNITIKTDVAGFGIEYQQTESKDGTTSDGFFGTFDGKTGATSTVQDAKGFGVTTSLAGNKVQLRNYEVDGVRDNKVIVTRSLASGATAEVTYVNGDSDTMLDVELLVKF
jgi:hypothetical protein